MANLLNQNEVCDLLKISRMQLWRLEKAEKIQPAKIVGRRKRYSKEELLNEKKKLYL